MKNSLLVHQHLIIRAEAIKPPTDEEQLTEWMKDFISFIDMKVFMGPYVKYCQMEGNRGITAVAIIETSHIAMHVWDEPSICSKIKSDFNIEKIEYKFLNRETGLVDITSIGHDKNHQ
jgi:S-adenosylmethionine/arginine decarboxylase-like enzyme